MEEPFKARLKFNKDTVFDNTDHLTLYLRPIRIFLLNLEPRVRL